ncbi:MAG: hypothetical protein HN736_11395 [Anaerolineae bacterium]|jgi:hypothetical protein|nr:hypothetical protein [Anaerolineae bacterium]MBT4309692.1 hypothetical protein [Anaerolineae bacterium]MBT4456885.1 hypothetical protein [Anaerolineae bacterium]MBT4843733.1 hypothetical protein [Anaerolineae bacterium]MBT6062401.1 hypothetical protein [Anaerolineae bacterium]
MSNNHNYHEKRSNFLWPIILIAVGIAFLFQNLGLLSDSVWSNIFNYWPLLLILLGVNDLLRTRSIAGPTFSIGLGAIFLANNLNLLNWSSWMSLLNLWPVLIIAIGLEIFIGRKNIWLSAVGVGITISLLALGLWLSGGVLGDARDVRTGSPVLSEEIEQAIGKAKSAQVNIDSSVGSLSVNSLSDDDILIEGTIYSNAQETIYQEYEVDGSEINYYLSSDWESSTITSFSGFEKQKLSWDLSLTEEIPLDLDISLGVGESNLDLSDIQVTDLSLGIGVGQTTVVLPEGEYEAYIAGGVGQSIITLPDEGQIKLNVDGGVGEIVLYIPNDMATKIYVDRGIAGLSVPSGYTQSNDVYTSSNYDEGEEYLELHLDQGIGNIAVREK